MTVEPGTFGTLRELNRLRVVDALRRAGTASRTDLARTTGISRTTVATLVSDLQARGLIVEMPDARAQPSGRGRPPVLLRLDAAAGAALGVDFDHRHVRVAVADLSSTVLAERLVELDVDSALRRTRSTQRPSSRRTCCQRQGSIAAASSVPGWRCRLRSTARKACSARPCCRTGPASRPARSSRGGWRSPSSSTTTPTSGRSPRSPSARGAGSPTSST